MNQNHNQNENQFQRTRSVWLSACQGIVTRILCAPWLVADLSTISGDNNPKSRVVPEVSNLSRDFRVHQRWFSVIPSTAAHTCGCAGIPQRKIERILRVFPHLGNRFQGNSKQSPPASSSDDDDDGKPSSHARLTCQSSELITWKEWKGIIRRCVRNLIGIEKSSSSALERVSVSAPVSIVVFSAFAHSKINKDLFNYFIISVQLHSNNNETK